VNYIVKRRIAEATDPPSVGAAHSFPFEVKNLM
jgi:hypothetical protein